MISTAQAAPRLEIAPRTKVHISTISAASGDDAAMPPDVSVVVVARDHVTLTLRCLTSLARLPDDPSFEVVLVDDGSQDDTPAILEAIAGDLRTLRNEEPVGFAAACDQAVAAASAEHIVLLHDDAVPCDGWLTALTDALAADPRLGAVAPRSIDLAGAFLDEPHWLALAVRRAAYTQVGGFTGTAQPDQAEKAALLDGLRAAGWGVAQEPEAILLLIPDALAAA
jgi:cellulose synthase/poly-beta-1,6-N-acetylglucosamine synthase-like glycosyltransferase